MFNGDHIHVLLFAKKDSKLLSEYFGLMKGQFTAINYYPVAAGVVLISMFPLLEEIFKENGLEQVKQKLLKGPIELARHSSLLQQIDKMFGLVAFNEKTRKSTQLKFDLLFRYNDYDNTFFRSFYDMYDTFSGVDNYYSLSQVKLGFCSYAILKPVIEEDQSFFCEQIKSISSISSSLSKGDKIICLNSNLSSVSFKHFSSSYSYGVVSSYLLPDTILLDIRALPSSNFAAIIDEQTKQQIAILLPVLNTKFTFTPLIFALRLDYLFNYLEKECLKISYDRFNLTLSLTKPSLIMKPEIESSVFTFHYNSIYGTCFHIGNLYFLTNKHLFEEYTQGMSLFISNHIFERINVNLVFISPNDLDVAVISVNTNLLNDLKISKLKQLPKIKISDSFKVEKLREVYSFSFNYFSLDKISKLNIPSYSTGEVNKVIKNRFGHFFYQISCQNYSGASGSPILDKETDSLIGIMYENISFQSDKGKIEIGAACFCVSKEVLSGLVKLIDLDYINFSLEANKLPVFMEENKLEINNLLSYAKF